jgi:hypothetical protein
MKPFVPTGVGSSHRTEDLSALGRIDMDQAVKWRQALNTLRALTFPPFRNLVIHENGRAYHVEISITEITSESEKNSGHDPG